MAQSASRPSAVGQQDVVEHPGRRRSAPRCRRRAGGRPRRSAASAPRRRRCPPPARRLAAPRSRPMPPRPAPGRARLDGLGGRLGRRGGPAGRRWPLRPRTRSPRSRRDSASSTGVRSSAGQGGSRRGQRRERGRWSARRRANSSAKRSASARPWPCQQPPGGPGERRPTRTRRARSPVDAPQHRSQAVAGAAAHHERRRRVGVVVRVAREAARADHVEGAEAERGEDVLLGRRVLRWHEARPCRPQPGHAPLS